MKEKSSFYHPELDVLRFCAFLQVFYFHIGNIYISGNGLLSHHGWKTDFLAAFIKAGALGVDLFFCLSSFLITALLLRECDLNGTLDVKQFWIRRILRIWPLYFVFLAIGAFILPHIEGLGQPLGPRYLTAYALFCGNWACVFGGAPASPVAPLWSVSIEEQFYILWPLLLFTLTPRRLVPLAVSGLIVATATRITLVLTGAIHSPNPVVWMNTLTRIDPIAVGALCAVAIHGRPWRPTRNTRVLLGAVGFFVPALMIFLMGGDNSLGGAGSIIFYPAIAVCCACVLGAVYHDEPIRMPTFPVYLGRISYGLYVFHMLAIITVEKMLPSNASDGIAKLLNAFILVGATSALTLGMAALSYRYLEQWFLKLKSRFTVIRSAPVKVTVAD